MFGRWTATLRTHPRDVAALAIVGVTFMASSLVLAGHRPAIDVDLASDANGLATSPGQRVLVASVEPGGVAWSNGIRPGMVVVALNGVQLVDLPAFVYPDVPPTPDPVTGEEAAPEPIGIEPPTPQTTPIEPSALAALLAAPVTDLEAIQPWELDRGKPDRWNVTSVQVDSYAWQMQSTGTAMLAGALLMVAVAWWLASGRGGATLRPMAIPLATATAVPFLVRPLEATMDPRLDSLGSVLMVAAMVPLSAALVERINDPDERRLAAVISAAAAGLAAGLAVALIVPGWADLDTGLFGALLVGAIALVPGLAAAGPSSGTGATSGRLLEATEFAVAGATPFFALLTADTPYVFPLGLWIAFVLVAGRFTVRPLARIASRATLQRDLVVAATEAERARVAADIHDDALQELTLLVHRLDAAGDEEGADIARAVSDRLRAICGDLRLPILDDLGVGPALDWLVLRIERLAGGEVRLERSDGQRPPPDVELAIFRVAQEAMSNAVKHGRPPIVVRYSSSASGASLSIDDAGPGFDVDATTVDAATVAEPSGNFGLLNMQQRAEAIGAILDVRRWPAGGTHVALDWRAP